MRRRADERRRAPRIRISLPVRFEDGGAAVSRDVSAVGILVETDRQLPHGQTVRLSLTLGEWDTTGGFTIHGEGRVVRTETTGGRPGVALDMAWSDVEPLTSQYLGAPAPEPDDPPAVDR